MFNRNPDPTKSLIEILPKDLSIPLQGTAFRSAEDYLRNNLSKMAEIAERGEVAILFCSVACNLRDQSPLYSISRDGMRPDERRRLDGLLAKARSLLLAGDADSALSEVNQAAEIDDGFALVSFRRAQCFEAQGKPKKAAAGYARARDLDGCRFRAPGAFRDIIRDVANSPDHSQAFFVDVTDALAKASEYSVPGNDLFMEHVHFNYEGHWQVALAVSKGIIQQVENATWDPSLVPDSDERDRLLGTTIFDHMMAVGMTETILKDPPLSAAPDSDLQLEFAIGFEKSIVDKLPLADLMMFMQLDGNPKQLDLINGIGAALLARGENERGLEMFERGKLRRPWEITSYVGAAKAHNRLGYADRALRNIRLALELSPEDPDLLQIHRDLSWAQ